MLVRAYVVRGLLTYAPTCRHSQCLFVPLAHGKEPPHPEGRATVRAPGSLSPTPANAAAARARANGTRGDEGEGSDGEAASDGSGARERADAEQARVEVESRMRSWARGAGVWLHPIHPTPGQTVSRFTNAPVLMLVCWRAVCMREKECACVCVCVYVCLYACV